MPIIKTLEDNANYQLALGCTLVDNVVNHVCHQFLISCPLSLASGIKSWFGLNNPTLQVSPQPEQYEWVDGDSRDILAFPEAVTTYSTARFCIYHIDGSFKFVSCVSPPRQQVCEFRCSQPGWQKLWTSHTFVITPKTISATNT